MSGAIIIPFPVAHRPSCAAVTSPVLLDERLGDALQGLHAALEEQAQAVKAWRFAMAELSVGVSALGHAMAAYDGSLSSLDSKLTGLRNDAAALEAVADRVLVP